MNLQNSAYNKNETPGFNVEATFKGQKALTFMKRMWYEVKPVQQTIYEKIFPPPAQVFPSGLGGKRDLRRAKPG